MKDVQCRPEATRLALHWMVPSGDVDTCLVVAEHLAAGGHAHVIFQANTSGDALLLPGLLPATSYRISLTVLGRNGLWSRVVTLLCATSAEGEHFPWSLEPLSTPLAFLQHHPLGSSLPWLSLPGALPVPPSSLPLALIQTPGSPSSYLVVPIGHWSPGIVRGAGDVTPRPLPLVIGTQSGPHASPLHPQAGTPQT